MSKHHHDRAQWQEIMQQGRRTKRAGGGKPEPGAAAPGAPAARPQQPLRRPRPAQPHRGASRAGASASGATSAGALSAALKASAAKASAASPGAPAAARVPQLDGQGLPYITLAQLLKKLSLVGSGGAAKATVRAGGIRVNGVAETRPGRKLHQGDKVTISGHDHHVNLASG